MTETGNSRGALDLSQIVSEGVAATRRGAVYVTECHQANFNSIVGQSVKYPVVLEFYSATSPAPEVSSKLQSLANESGGSWVLARINVDTEQVIAQSIGVQAVPTVVAVLAGQLAPLFQGTRSDSEITEMIAMVCQSAVANGITGKAEPFAVSDSEGSQTPVEDPRLAAAEAAMEAGDYTKAIEEFDAILAKQPDDVDALGGRAMAALLARSHAFDPVALQVKAADSDDVQAQMDLADLEIIQGNSQAGLDRLIALIRQSRGNDELREQLRLRILELFEVVGRTSPVVMKARRKLSSALFAY